MPNFTLLKSFFSLDKKLINEEINKLFIILKIPLKSTASIIMKEAIWECIKDPELSLKIKNVYDKLAKKHHTSNSAIRSFFRTGLRKLNLYKDSIKSPIMRYFDSTENITPKEFIDVVLIYLECKQKKKK